MDVINKTVPKIIVSVNPWIVNIVKINPIVRKINPGIP